MSKEHVLPDWLKQVFPRRPNAFYKHSISNVERLPGQPITKEYRAHRRPGEYG